MWHVRPFYQGVPLQLTVVPSREPTSIDPGSPSCAGGSTFLLCLLPYVCLTIGVDPEPGYYLII